jgi:hypothetical protein
VGLLDQIEEEHMALRLPIEFAAEYRGQAPGGEFTRDDTGERVAFSPALKFEYEDENGDVVLIPIRAAQLDKCEPPFDHEVLQKGDELVLRGFVVLQDRGSDRDSYFAIRSVAYAAEAPLKAVAG